MNTFNLTFRGEIIGGRDPERVKRRFGELFFIDDPARLERFFSGTPITLRRNLERERASELFLTLREIGLKVGLERAESSPPPPRSDIHEDTAIDSQQRTPGRVDQRWAVGKAPRPRKTRSPHKATQEAAQQQTIKLLHQLREAKDAARTPGASPAAPQKPQKRLRKAPPKARFKVRKAARKTQTRPGQPNLFQLSPFRNTASVRQRADLSRHSATLARAVGLLAGIALLMAFARYFMLAKPGVLQGAYASATSASGTLLLATEGEFLLHDRAGIGTEILTLGELGLGSALPPILFVTERNLLLRGSLLNQSGGAGPEGLLRCNLSDELCSPFSDELEPGPDIALGAHPRTGSIFIADAGADKLYKFGPDGQLYAEVATDIPEQPSLMWRSGLLFMGSAGGPAISVFRPDDGSFGQQLDELLLLPPSAVERGQVKVTDFTWSAGHWWAKLSNPETASSGVYRFGEKWSFISEVALVEGSHADQLLPWGEKLLVRDAHQVDLQRYNQRGQAEPPLVSDLLNNRANAEQAEADITEFRWRLGMAILAVVAICTLAVARLFSTRALVYDAWPTRSAEPLEEAANNVVWIPPAARRLQKLQQLAIVYGFTCLIALSVSTLWDVTLSQWLALAIALAGPALALFIIYRNPPGYLGLISRELIMVDQRDTFHRGIGARIHYRGGFAMIDDIVIYTGNRLLPIFDEPHMRRRVWPIIKTGVKVDLSTLWIRALESRNSFALGAVSIALCLLSSAALLLVMW